MLPARPEASIASDSTSTSSRLGRWSCVVLACLSVTYFAVAGSTLSQRTVQWDEFTDLVIAGDIAAHPLHGSSRDPSQARLPMYVTAAAYRLMQWRDGGVTILDALPLSRYISVAMVILALWITAMLGQRLFDTPTALLAASLLAFSPLFLDFGRDALTQGDAFTPALVALALLAFTYFEERRTTLRLFALGMAVGLAVAAKFTLVVIVPALMFCTLVAELEHRPPRRPPDVAPDGTLRAHSEYRTDWGYLTIATTTLAFALAALTFSAMRAGAAPELWRALYGAGLAGWAGALLGLALSGTLAVRWIAVSRTGNEKMRPWPWHTAWFAVLALAAAMTLSIFPEHIFNPPVVLSVFERGATWDGQAEVFATVLASAHLYLGLLLLKLGLPFGIATVSALAWAMLRARHDRAVRLLFLATATYGVLLLILPLRQPFWLMAVYPVIILLLAAAVMQALRAHTSRSRRVVAATGMAVACLWLAFGVYRVYPTFGFYGYETIGDRWLGAPSRGYRSVVVVTNDGSTEALDWLSERASGSVVLSSLDDVFVLNSIDAFRPLPFRLRHASGYSSPGDLRTAIEDADFLLIRAIDDLPSPFAPFTTEIDRQFSTRPVHEIVRGRGNYRMPVIQIFKRRETG